MLFTPQKTNSSHSSRSKQNSFFSPSVQTKLAIGKPGDRYEVEADRTADTVVSRLKEPGSQANEQPTFFAPKPSIQRKPENIQQKESDENEQELEIQEKPLAESITPLVQTSLLPDESVQEKCDPVVGKATVQTKCADCEAKEKEAAATGMPVQQKCDKCAAEENTIQHKKDSTGSSGDISQQLSASKGGGTPMDKNTQSEMAQGFGTDFSNVRVHTDSNAVQMNKQLGSHAFTNGNDVYFNSGKYNPSSDSGKHLLAHELTHTVQQGSSGNKIAKKEDSDKEEITPLQTKLQESIIQKEDDPCAEPEEQGSEAEANAAETVPSDPNCAVSNAPAEEPPEGQEEPDGEDTARDIEANPGGPVDERQSHAPPADENAPADETGIQETGNQQAEQALDPCALREQQQAGAGQAGAAGAAGVAGAAAVGLTPEQPATQGNAQPSNQTENAGGNPANEGNAEQGNQEQGGDFLAERIQQGVSPLVQAQGLGEAASPELAMERDAKRMSAEETEMAILQTGEQANALAAGGAQFKLRKGARQKEKARQTEHSMKASSFLSSGITHIHSILSNGSGMAAEIRSAIETNKGMLMSDIAIKQQNVSAFYAQSRESASQKAILAKQNLAAQHASTLLQIEMSAMMANMQVQTAHQTKSQELEQTYTQQLAALGLAYTSGYNDLISAGNTKGNAVTAVAEEKAAEYRRAEGASEEVRNLVVNKEADGFWDGYLTYNRYMARADAAIEVGEQYKEGMVSQAQAQADKMMCGQEKDGEMLGLFFQKGNEMLQCALLNAQDAINRQKQAAIMQATHNLQEMNKNIDQSQSATIAELNQKEAVQLQLINDYGIRQLMAIERDGEAAIGGALQGVNEAAGKLLSFLQAYQQTVSTSETGDAATFQAGQQSIESQYAVAVGQAEQSVLSAKSSALTAVNDGGIQVLIALYQLYADGIADARMLVTAYQTSIDSLVASGGGIFTQIQQNTLQAISGEQLNGVNTINGVVTGVSGLLTNTVGSVGTRFTEAKTSMETGMQQTIDNDLSPKICSEAEKAAADVQPWWKTALKILLVIIVIVVVALVIGPAVIGAVGAAASALAGSLGAGAALAGTIGAWAGPIIGGAIVGALSGAVIQVGNNLIDIAGTDRELSWDNVTKGVVGAMIAGAIGGALGGLGGQFAQVLMGRIGAGLGPSMQAISKFGVEAVFDVIGGVLGDFAAGNPITWESIVMGLAIGGAVQVSMGGLSAIARNGVSAPHTDAGVSGPRLNPDGTPRTGIRSRIQDTARSIQDFQGRMMETGQNFGNRAGFGANAPTAVNTRQGIVDANARMEGGEFFPTRNPESTTPRGDTNTDVNGPRIDEDVDNTGVRNETGQDSNPRIDEDGENPRLNDPNAAPENSGITQADITNERNWVETQGRRRPSSLEGYTEEVELPNGHVWRKNESGGWCRFSSNPLLTGIPNEMFTLNMDILNLKERYIIPGNIIHAQLMLMEQQLRAQFTSSGSAATQNRNVLSTRLGFVVQDGSGNMRFLVFDPQVQFQSGLGIRTTTNTQIVPEIDPKVLGAYSTITLPENLTNQLLSNDPQIRKQAELNARQFASSRARSPQGSIGSENTRMGITSNTTGSLDFHSERAFYSWLRENPGLFAEAIKNLNINDPVVKAVIVDMASTRYVCPRCAMAGTNLASSGSDMDFISRIRGALEANLIGIDPDMSVKVRASAEMVFPVNKIMPNLTQFADILRINTGMPAVDFPVGTIDYDLLRVMLTLNSGDNAAIQSSLQTLQQNKPFLFNQFSMETIQEQLRLTSEIEGLRSLTPILCTL